MTAETISLLVRHGLTAVGPLLISQGLTTEGQLQEMAGGLALALGLLWSFVRKLNRAPVPPPS
jgi:hypothetical protein